MKTYKPELITTYPYFIQPKLNGVSAVLDTKGIFRSRTDKYFPAVQKVWKKDIYDIEYPLKGELYYPGWSLQRIMAAVVPDEPTEDSALIRFYAYDIVSDHTQAGRIWLLGVDTHLEFFSDNFYILPTYKIHNLNEGTRYYKQFLAEGYEGAVYRPYTFGDLLKRKPYKDEEYLLVDVIEGKGKRKGHVGAFVLAMEDGHTFQCGGGRISYDKLKEYWEAPPLNSMVTVRFHSKSDDGVPLCAQFLTIRPEGI